MELCHSNSVMDSPAVRRLAEFVAKHCEQRASENEATSLASLERFEQDTHQLVMR